MLVTTLSNQEVRLPSKKLLKSDTTQKVNANYNTDISNSPQFRKTASILS
jgi:hypothetical protein